MPRIEEIFKAAGLLLKLYAKLPAVQCEEKPLPGPDHRADIASVLKYSNQTKIEGKTIRDIQDIFFSTFAKMLRAKAQKTDETETVSR